MKFKSDIEVQAGLRDGSDDIGTAGQLLSSTGTITNWIDQSEVVAAGATTVLIACKNTSGATITKGTPVYQTGYVGATAVIEVAEADALISTGYLPAIGLLETDLINNAFGHVVITGELLNITTSPIDGVTPVTGDTIYLKSGGGLTLTKPTGEGNAIQNLGLVGKVSVGNAGSLTVASIMRQNDVPNLPEGRIWIGDGNTIVSDTVYVDEPNNRVGIGTTNPSTDLEVSSSGVNGVDISQSASNATQSGRLFFTTNTASEGFALFNANGTFQVNSGGIPNDTSGTNRISIIGSSGNVGIGTTSPSTKLHVSGGDIRIDDTERIEFGAGGVRINNDAAGRMYYRAPLGFYWETNGGYRMILNSLGNVGIGTTSPTQKLHVDGNARLTGLFYDGTNSGGTNGQILSSDGGQTEWIDGSAIPGVPAGSGAVNYLARWTPDNDTLGIGVTYDNGINVGIGTTSPNAKLDVYGGLHLGTTGNFSITQSPFSTTQFYVTGGGNGGTINFGAPASNTQNVSVQGDLYSYNGSIGTQQFGIQNNKISYNGDNYLNSGNLGIGTTSPNRLLTVETTGSGCYLALNSSSNNTTIGSDVNGAFVVYDDSSATYRMVIDQTTGNIGVNTTNPYAKLHVASTSSNNVPTAGTATGGLWVSTSSQTFGINMGVSSSGWGFIQSQRADTNTTLYNLNLQPLGGNVGIGTTTPQSKLQVNGGVQLANDTAAASASKVGTFRYRTSGNNSYVDMCMQTGASTYAWVNIVTNSW